MAEIRELLKAREKQLLQVRREKEKALKRVPEGTLRICCSKSRVQYYLRTDPKDFNGSYIQKHDRAIAEKLAQKDYDQRVLDASEKELNAIKKYFSSCPERNIEEIYESLHRERQKLVVPVKESDEEYIRNWECVEYDGKDFYESQAEYYTVKGERVRSKSEMIIADSLTREGIPYRYEYPVYLEQIGDVYPDFTVLNVKLRKEIYWEHMGMMDDPQYVETAVRKIASYGQNGIFPGKNLILTFETKQNPINRKWIVQLIKTYLQ